MRLLTLIASLLLSGCVTLPDPEPQRSDSQACLKLEQRDAQWFWVTGSQIVIRRERDGLVEYVSDCF